MEGDSTEIQAEINNTELENKQGKADVTKGGDSKVRKKRKQSELPSPTSDRPTRERKSVERLIISPDKEVKEFKILKGTGTALKDIPNIVFKLSKRRGGDELVQALHKVLFGKTSKHAAKSNILKFSGFSWSGIEEKEKLKVRDRLERLVKETLFQISDLLDANLSKGLKKEEAVLKVFEFLESPHKTTDKLLEENAKLKKGKKKAAKGAKRGRPLGKSPKGKKKTPRKSRTSDEEDEDNIADSEDAVEETEDVEDEPEDVEDEPEEKSDDDDYNDKKKSPRKTKRKRKSTKEKSMQESEDEEKEASPKKRRKVQKEETKPSKKANKEKKSRGRPAKVKEPSDEDLKAAICELLRNVDFSKVTFTDVMKQLGDKFKVDLTHKKSHLKALIQEEIARLVGEGDNEDEDSNTEGGDDEEKQSGEQKDHEDSKQRDHEDSEQKDQEDVSKESSKEENEDGDGDVEDSHGEEEDGKGEKVGDEDEDEDMNSGEDKADDVGEDEDGVEDGGDTKAEVDEEAAEDA